MLRLARPRKSKLASETHPHYAAIFRKLDRDGDGTLSVEELRRALMTNEDFARVTGAPSTLSPLAATAVASHISQASDDSVSVNEFCQWLVRVNAQAQSDILDKAGASSAPAEAGPGRGKAGAAQPARGEHLMSRLWPGKSADAAGRNADARWAAVQQMLRDDVLNATEELMARATSIANPTELADLYRAQLLHVTDHVRRLVASEEESARGAGADNGAGPALESLDAEVLRLRKELSLSKLELAEALGKRDELEHRIKALYRETEAKTQESLGF